MTDATGFEIPTYPYDRLAPIEAIASATTGGLIDLSIGTPCDPPPPFVVDALARTGAERGYPTVASTAPFVDAARGLIERRFDVPLERASVGVCIGTKELVAGVPHWLRLRSPGRDTVLYPAVSYPTYAMGALLASCRAVPVPVAADGRLLLERIDPDDAARALVLWSNSPSNPTGGLDDLGAVAEWGRRHGVPVFSDECYFEFTWERPAASILQHGIDGVVAVHSLSKRSNAAGCGPGTSPAIPNWSVIWSSSGGTPGSCSPARSRSRVRSPSATRRTSWSSATGTAHGSSGSSAHWRRSA